MKTILHSDLSDRYRGEYIDGIKSESSFMPATGYKCKGECPVVTRSRSSIRLTNTVSSGVIQVHIISHCDIAGPEPLAPSFSGGTESTDTGVASVGAAGARTLRAIHRHLPLPLGFPVPFALPSERHVRAHAPARIVARRHTAPRRGQWGRRPGLQACVLEIIVAPAPASRDAHVWIPVVADDAVGQRAVRERAVVRIVLCPLHWYGRIRIVVRVVVVVVVVVAVAVSTCAPAPPVRASTAPACVQHASGGQGVV